MRRLLELEAETASVQAEFDELVPDDDGGVPVRTASARTQRQPRTVTSAPVVPSGNGNGSGQLDWEKRGVLTEALREAMRVQRGEWSARQIADAAKVPHERLGSAKAAVSRMLAAGEIEKGTKDGTYRAKQS
jgi:hypothetical protein